MQKFSKLTSKNDGSKGPARPWTSSWKKKRIEAPYRADDRDRMRLNAPEFKKSIEINYEELWHLDWDSLIYMISGEMSMKSVWNEYHLWGESLQISRSPSTHCLTSTRSRSKMGEWHSQARRRRDGESVDLCLLSCLIVRHFVLSREWGNYL